MQRRTFLMTLAAGAIAPAAGAHTLYNQWIVFRQKHLLIGSHRKDPVTYDLARDVVSVLDHLLPEASARPARAPHPQRLASLLGTGQLYLAILSPGDAVHIREGTAQFTAYGRIPLRLIGHLGTHVIVGHADFPAHHAWLVTAALQEAAYFTETDDTALELHDGARAMLAGDPFEALKPE